jgi:hypothetical protein
VWEITEIKDPRDSDIAKMLYEECIKPVIGTRVVLYPGGLAKAVGSGRGGEWASPGRYVVDESAGKVVIRFGKTPVWVAMEFNCEIRHNQLIDAGDGGAIVLTKRHMPLGSPPEEEPLPWDELVKDESPDPPSDGKENLPGVQEGFP